MLRTIAVTLLLGATAISSAGFAQTAIDHSAMRGNSAAMPLTEPGQGAFAALSEVVALLRSNPNTNWAAVDINGLRSHLVDMDNLVTLTEVVASQIDGGIEMRISLGGKGGGAAARMVPAHGPVLAAETGWSSNVSRDADALIWRVTDPDSAAIIRALGFYGLMAVGDHHRAHHLRLAKGEAIQ